MVGTVIHIALRLQGINGKHARVVMRGSDKTAQEDDAHQEPKCESWGRTMQKKKKA